MKINGVVRLATDVEIRYTQSGTAFAKFAVVSSDKRKNQSGQEIEDTCFIDAVVWGRLAEICNQYLQKGAQIYIDGKLKHEKWTAEDGSKRSKHSISIENLQMLGSKKDSNNSGGYQGQGNHENYQTQNQTGYQAQNNGAQQQYQGSTTQNQENESIPEIDIDTDEIPF